MSKTKKPSRVHSVTSVDIGIQVNIHDDPKLSEEKGENGGRIDNRTKSRPEAYQKKSLLKGRCLILASALVVLALAILLSSNHVANFYRQTFNPSNLIIVEDVAAENMILFNQHDEDDDGFISSEEFQAIAELLLQVNDSGSKVYDVPISDWDEVVTIQSAFQPILLSTLTLTKDSAGLLGGHADSLASLKKWKTPVMEWQNFGASHFAGFLPREQMSLAVVGEPYYIIKPPFEGSRGPNLPSTKYYPSRLVKPMEITLHRLLAMFHPRPFVYCRFAPQGSVALVRAYNEKFVDIVFRIHAEFQLNEPPAYPFWYTPGQFTGNIVISRDASKVLSFHLYVPNDKRLNVDMEWLNGLKDSDGMEVDIGYMPVMSLHATASSVPVWSGDTDVRGDYMETKSEFHDSSQPGPWTEDILLEEAYRILEIKMYPFKEVPYYNFTQAFSKAEEVSKPVHSIMLWGALDDQSC